MTLGNPKIQFFVGCASAHSNPASKDIEMNLRQLTLAAADMPLERLNIQPCFAGQWEFHPHDVV